jgi:NAD(P)-dependent dehydrogenase (short-subunit alcohol dehydrogenase family)
MNSKNVFLTGGSRGIGKAVKDKFIAAGYVVCVPRGIWFRSKFSCDQNRKI